MSENKRFSSARPGIAPREWLVAVTASLTLAFTAWGLAGVVVWSLHTMLAGGVFCLLSALCPLPSALNGTDGEHGNLKNLLRFLKSPAVWFGLAFLLYLLVQALNPSAEVVRNDRGWWVEGRAPALSAKLPSSVESDYVPMNAWRIGVLFTAAFSLMAGVLAGIRRRFTARLMLWSFVLSGVGMAVLAMVQHFDGADKVLWTVASENDNFWGTFFYRNHGAAFLNLVLVAAGLLYFVHARRSRERAASGGPHFLLFLFVGVVAASVGLALSRGGILFGMILTGAFVLGAVLDYLVASFTARRSAVIGLILAGLLAAGGYLTYHSIDWEAMEERFGDIEATIAEADRDARAISSRATWDMARERLAFGWGAGSFRYIFPMFQREYPEIFYQRYHPRKEQWVGRKVYRYAHNDIFQFVAEYGLAGSGLVLGAILSLILPLLRFLRSSFFVLGLLFLGLFCAFAHAFVDFIFNNPAYWVAFIGVLAAANRVIALEGERA